jgi:hypothetical protein
MDSAVNKIIDAVNNARMGGHTSLVFKTDKLDGPVYPIMALVKEKMAGYVIWYVDPMLTRAPHQVVEEWGLHIDWTALVEK